MQTSNYPTAFRATKNSSFTSSVIHMLYWLLTALWLKKVYRHKTARMTEQHWTWSLCLIAAQQNLFGMSLGSLHFIRNNEYNSIMLKTIVSRNIININN